ncbi:MAG: amidohydrolase family protein [Crocinitomicaceae bacterium]|nr:amidohydrolase family protein [Crocinitomicaceae bacterium]
MKILKQNKLNVFSGSWLLTPAFSPLSFVLCPLSSSLKTTLIFVIAFALNLNLYAQTPAPINQKHTKILLQNGAAHIGNGEFIPTASIGIENGKILFVKNTLTMELVKSEWDTIIDLNGQHVYPGFIAPNVTTGLTEVDAVRATRDFNETGIFNPNVRSLIAYNTDSKILYTIRTNGVLVTQTTPRGGTISGTSSVMALDGWNWEDAVYKADDGVHLNWPEKYNRWGWWAEPGGSNSNENYVRAKNEIWDFCSRAKAYVNEKYPDEMDLKLEAMRHLFNGDQRLYFHVDFAPEMNDVVDFVRFFEIKNPVIVGGYDAPMIADRLKENKFSIIINRPHALPEFEDDFTYQYYELPYKLQEAGLLFCISTAGDMEVMNTRNLPFLAGTARAYGMTEEQAVASISLNAAKILGLDDKIGSLEAGKDATLFVSQGDALDMRSNNVTLAMIRGNFIDLNNHQKELYEKYCKKYGLVVDEY